LIGHSLAMRRTFTWLEYAAACDITVLLQGETGTGKGEAALSLHQESARKAGPFKVVDCGSFPPSLVESELFGYEKGAFTGADTRHIGALEQAHGGTLFLDEIGELPLELQSRLLRVLQNRQVRRLGSSTYIPVDLRIVAATHRDLRADTNAGRFRLDRYFRLGGAHIYLPPLRQRLEDLPDLAVHLLKQLGASPQESHHLLTPELLTLLQQRFWKGNVRELQHYLELCHMLKRPPPESRPFPSLPCPTPDINLPYVLSKERVMQQHDRSYFYALLQAHAHNLSSAAKASGLSRAHLYTLLRRHHLLSSDSS